MAKTARTERDPYGIGGLHICGSCPITGRTYWTHPDWNVELPHYSSRMLLLDARTVLCLARGIIHAADTEGYCSRFERLYAAVVPDGGKIHLIEDWSDLRSADTEARRIYVAYHIRHRDRLASMRFFGLNGLTRLLVNLSKALHVVPFALEIHPDYGSVLKALGFPVQGSAPGGPRPLRKLLPLPGFLLRGHARRLADIFGALQWGAPGEVRNPLSERDPFHDLVAGWIAVKADLDHLNERSQQHEANFRAVMESAREGVWLCDGTGTTLWVNGSMASLVGTTVAELSSLRLSDLLPPDLFEQARARTTEPQELRIPRPDGKDVWVMVSAGPIPGGRDEHAGLYAICSNITGRRKAEEKVRDIADDLERRVVERTGELAMSNRLLEEALRSREEFLAAMSHELRTPLATILNISESLRGGVQGSLEERQIERLRVLENNGHHLLALIRDVLDLSKSLAGRIDLLPTAIDVGSLCGECLNAIRPFAESQGIELQLELPADPVVAMLDPLRVRQILTNLLSNACKFPPRGTRAGLVLATDAQARVVRMSVWDEGPGIAPEAVERLFMPFVQLDNRLSREHGGTGLGLALSRRLAEQHGGRILLETKPGEGCRFTVELPGYEPESEPPTEGSILHASGGVPRNVVRERRILVAEDNNDLRQTVQEYLEAAGWQVRTVSGGAEALDAFQEELSDIVLMDIQMPGMDGLEAIRRLRELPRGAFPKVVAISGLAFPEDMERSKAAGADLHLAKPVRLGQLVLILDDLLGT